MNSGKANLPLAGDLQQAGIDVTLVDLPPRALTDGNAARSRRFAAACANVVAYAISYRADVVDAPVARRMGIPAVTTVHGFTGGAWKDPRFLGGLDTRTFAASTGGRCRFTTVGEALLASGSPREVHVAPNAWVRKAAFLDPAGPRRALGLSDDGFQIAWVGRLSQEKGQTCFSKRLADSAGSTLPGVDHLRRTRACGLENLAQRLAIENRLTWHGAIANAAGFLPAFDLLVFSRTEEPRLSCSRPWTPACRSWPRGSAVFPMSSAPQRGAAGITRPAIVFPFASDEGGLGSPRRSSQGAGTGRQRAARRAVCRSPLGYAIWTRLCGGTERGGGRPGARCLLVSYFFAASLRCQASNVGGVTGKTSVQRVRGISPASAANHTRSAGS